MTRKKYRLNLELTKQVMDRLNRLVEQNDADSKTDVIRRALVLYETITKLHNEEGRIIVLLKNGNQRELIF